MGILCTLSLATNSRTCCVDPLVCEELSQWEFSAAS